MEPQTPIQPTPPTSAPSPQYKFDPTTVALTKAIGEAESGGNYGAGDNTGDGANSYGAYQMTPSFLQNWAPKAGVQYQQGMQLNPQQQDEIASTAVQSMLKEGKIPAQVVSEWNTGDPNAYLDSTYGENNTYGSTQNEVNKVAEYYKQFTQSPPDSTPSSSGSSSNGVGTALGLGAGALAVGGLATVATDGEDLLGGALGDVGGWIQDALGITGLKDAITSSAGGGASGGGTTTPPPTGTNPENVPQGGQPQSNQPDEQADISQAENESATQSKSALASIANGVKDMLQGAQPGRIFSQNPAGKSAIGTATAFNLIGQDENGNAVFDENARQQALKEVANLDDKVAGSSGGAVSPMLVSNLAGNEISQNRLMTASARQQTGDIIGQEMKSDLGNLGPNTRVDAPRLRELAKQHNAAASQAYKEGNYTPTPKSMAHKALGRAYANALDKALEGDPHAQELHRRAMKMEEHLIRAKELKKYIHGKKIPKNNGLWQSFLRQGARAAEIYIGDKLGGPVGAIIGGLIGEGLNRKITSHFGKNIFSTPGMRAAFKTLKDTKPKEYDDLVSALKKHGAEIPEEPQKPTTQSGLVHVVKESEKKFEGRKGLVKP